MEIKKVKFKPNMNNSIDFFNFCTANNDLPKMDILNEQFKRIFRVELSNYISTITNLEYKTDKISLQDWKKNQSNLNCMFILKSKTLNGSILIKLDRSFSYGIIDILAGGNGIISEHDKTKGITSLENELLKNIGNMITESLENAWSPLNDLKVSIQRTENDVKFLNFIPDNSQMIRVINQINFNKQMGQIEILYPYSTLFPIRDKLFSSDN